MCDRCGNRNAQRVLTGRLLYSSGNFVSVIQFVYGYKDVANINRYPYERFIKESQSKRKLK